MVIEAGVIAGYVIIWAVRKAAMLGLARRAGYADGQILPIEYPVCRFYRLVP